MLARLDQLVVKPTGESGGRGVMIGPHAERGRDRAHARSCCRQHPERWIAQDVVRLSTVPTVGPADGRLVPRHVDLRPFAVFGERIDIVPGGLTRVALEEGSMIVNSSRGGGSKDTWVLEDGDDADRAGPADRRHAAAGAARPALRRLDRPAAAATAAECSALMLARIAHELYWLGRNLARAEFTARAVEAVFQAELQGASDRCPSVSFGSGGLLAMLGDARGAGAHGATQTLGSLTLDAETARLDAREHRARARGRAHGARRDQRRDVGGDQHDRARPARRRQPGWAAPAGPYLASQYVKQRTALIWGVADRSMLRDEAKCFLDAGGLIEVSDMVLRMLRVALPPGGTARPPTDTR